MKSKTVLITGASRGIGLGIAQKLANHVGQLALVASTLESFAEVKEQFDPKTKYYAADFCSVESLQELAKSLSKDFDKIDVLVNNCGGFLEKSISDIHLDELQALINLNLSSPIILTKAILPLLKKLIRPQVINISSISALRTPANQTVYAASKAGLTGFSRALRKELSADGIRVCTIHPSGVNTWNDPNPIDLLRIEDVANLVHFVISSDPDCQIEEVSLSALSEGE